MNSILVIDDDDQLRISFCKLLKEENYSVIGAASGEAGIEIVKQNPLDLVVLDMRLPGINGIETFKRIKNIDSKLPVIIVTAFGTTDIAIEATKMGAYDYVLKPFDVPVMLNLIKQAIEAGYFMRSPVKVDASPDNQSGDAIIGQNKLMQDVYKSIGRVSQTDATVLIQGESGTGKELVARAVYQHGLRSEKAFLIINCVAIPETLLESELFGYEKGAFTGASQRHIGKIELDHPCCRRDRPTARGLLLIPGRRRVRSFCRSLLPGSRTFRLLPQRRTPADPRRGAHPVLPDPQNAQAVLSLGRGQTSIIKPPASGPPVGAGLVPGRIVSVPCPYPLSMPLLVPAHVPAPY